MTIEQKPASEQPTLIVKLWDWLITEKRKPDETTPLLQKSEGQKTFYYLAYGSNLSASTFKGRRGIKPMSATNVLCPGQALVFDLDGIPYWEPCFANIREVAPEEQLTSGSGEVWKNALIGVVYEVTVEDYATIIRTEGGGAGYKDVEVDCYVLPKVDEQGISSSVTIIKAHTLRAPPNKTNPNSTSQPSLRYLGLLVTGAKENSLPQAYINYLSSLHGYYRTTWPQKVGAFLFLGQWILPIAAFLNFKNLFSDKKTGQSPRWMQKFEGGMWAAIWFTYRWIYKPIWGDGQRTIGDDMDICRGGSGEYSEEGKY
ncbi:gliotoxin biosynthesis protein GliK [Tirmania nivea]|nr:gliotoxin biosynthesis protein GliK [Tirmania nivea]